MIDPVPTNSVYQRAAASGRESTVCSLGSRVPALDGWRGIAILMVLIDHSNLYCGFPFPWLMWLGQHGVTLFFVLSGYLITSRLVIEKEEKGRISLKSFYLRRFFRILPCAWIYLIFLALYRNLPAFDALSCILFFRNFANAVGDTFTVHFWSLSIEEQFYLIWPGVLILLGTRKGRGFALAAACIIAVHRFMNWAYLIDSPFLITSETQWRADSLLIGCVAALLPTGFRIKSKPHRLLVSIALLGLAVCLFCFHELIPLCEASLMAFLIWSTSTKNFPVVSRVLGSRPLRILGVASYSLYVWQGYAFRLPLQYDLKSFGTKLLLLAFLATGSYLYVERPMVRFGARLIRRLSFNSEPLQETA